MVEWSLYSNWMVFNWRWWTCKHANKGCAYSMYSRCGLATTWILLLQSEEVACELNITLQTCLSYMTIDGTNCCTYGSEESSKIQPPLCSVWRLNLIREDDSKGQWASNICKYLYKTILKKPEKHKKCNRSSVLFMGKVSVSCWISKNLLRAIYWTTFTIQWCFVTDQNPKLQHESEFQIMLS